MEREITLEIIGLGLIMFSKYAVEHIKEGDDYFSKHYLTGEQVENHLYQGTIIGFCTSSPGKYILKIKEGCPEESTLISAEYKLHLGIKVEGGKVHFRDLYALMDWKVDYYPDEQSIAISDGYYLITLLGNEPKSGIIGDNQEISIYFNKADCMPELEFYGVPIFCQ